MTFGVDSGSAATVIKRSVGADYPLDTRQRRSYTAANKMTITMDGARVLQTTRGRIKTEVGDVNKNLMAVSDLCDSGHRVVFDNDEGNYAVHKKTGAIHKFDRIGKVYNVQFEVVPYSQSGNGCGGARNP